MDARELMQQLLKLDFYDRPLRALDIFDNAFLDVVGAVSDVTTIECPCNLTRECQPCQQFAVLRSTLDRRNQELTVTEGVKVVDHGTSIFAFKIGVSQDRAKPSIYMERLLRTIRKGSVEFGNTITTPRVVIARRNPQCSQGGHFFSMIQSAQNINGSVCLTV